MLNLENYSNLRAVHVIKDGQIAYEYFREDTNNTQLFPVGCIFKSFLSVLVGIAIYEGKIGSIEDCVIDYIPHEEINDINWYKLKIRHALSKTTGLIWPGPMKSLPANMAEVMQLKFNSEPGTNFQYKPDPQIIVYLLEEIYGMDITDLFEEKIVSSFSNKEYQWDRASIENMQVSIQLLDELGQLMLNTGFANKKQLFSKEYYEQSIYKYSLGGPPEGVAYGLSWWIDFYGDISFFFASGFGGQYVIVIPQKNMTISILSDMDRPHPGNKRIMELLFCG